MRLFILAAGVGSRLFPLTKDTPKSLLDIGCGSTLLDRQIFNAINSRCIDDVIIITGYKHSQIAERIKEFEEKINISTIFNPFYDISNNLVSLWCVTHLMLEKDFMVTNGDNIYKDYVYDHIVSESRDNAIQLTINYKDNYDSDDMKVILNNDCCVTYVSKDIDPVEAMAESVGLALVRGESKRKIFSEKIIDMIKDKSYLSRYWLEIFNSLVCDGLTIKTSIIDRDDWREMDFHPDMEEIKRKMLKNLF